MAAIDKPFEDLYAYLKARWWGIPTIVAAVLASLVFIVWSSLPNSTKERVLGESPSSEKAAAAISSPVPPQGQGSGTSSARVRLPAQSQPLVALVQGEATAHVSDGGWMEVRVYVSGTSEPCETSKVYKNRTSDNILSGMATCTVNLAANTPYEFRLEAPNQNADGRTATLRVSYSR